MAAAHRGAVVTAALSASALSIVRHERLYQPGERMLRRDYVRPQSERLNRLRGAWANAGEADAL